MFTDLLPVKARKVLYAVYGSLGYVIGSIAAAFLAIGHSNPQWFAIAIAVYAYLAGPFGKLAGDNAPATPANGGTVA